MTQEPDDTATGPVDDDPSSEPATTDLGSAYQRLGVMQPFLNTSLRDIVGANRVSAADIIKNATAAHNIDTREMIRNLMPRLNSEAPSPVFAMDQDRLPIEVDIPLPIQDDSPRRTADATEQMAQRLNDMHAVTVDLASLTATNLKLTEAQRAAADRVELFSRRMTVASLAIAVASLAASIVAIVVTVTTAG